MAPPKALWGEQEKHIDYNGWVHSQCKDLYAAGQWGEITPFFLLPQ